MIKESNWNDSTVTDTHILMRLGKVDLCTRLIHTTSSTVLLQFLSNEKSVSNFLQSDRPGIREKLRGVNLK